MKRVSVCVVLSLLSLSVLTAQSNLQSIANVKLYKTEPITIKQVKSRVEAYEKEMGRSLTVEERKQVLDSLINERLVVQAAERDGIRVSDNEVNQYFTQNLSQMVGRPITEAEFAQMIKQQTGMSLDDYIKAQNNMSLVEYKGFMKNQLVAQRYVMTTKQAELQSISGPSDTEIRSNYELYKQNFVQPDMAKLFLVVVPKGDNSTAAKKKIEELRAQLVKDPSAINDVKIRSQAANSGYQAGDIYLNKNATAAQQMGLTMDALLKIFQINVNSVSEVTETATDFQFFLVQEKYPAKILELSDIVRPGTTITVYEYIKGNLTEQAQQIAVNEALTQIINELRKPENFQILKSGEELDKALTW
ncbi:peptidylprolyl isomerase [Brucepastera parasyntrophica]|uniref:MOSP complex formation periplasmic protein, TDE1658 family n=1 Tax=Brucepastera parasyntrophica TaxID=2880008 RepID=UPI002109E098|nr:peptidylprolyl isomerase [Brucepastera parasyntrophica]ULQ60591.1 peptidylprolyl isomerase [Brucepastera parasyntrophica]